MPSARLGRIDRPTANAALTMLEVDAHGFDEIDRKLRLAIIQKYDGGPVGLSTLAATLAEEQDALEEVYEPFLIQIGFSTAAARPRGHASGIRALWPVDAGKTSAAVLKCECESVSMETYANHTTLTL